MAAATTPYPSILLEHEVWKLIPHKAHGTTNTGTEPVHLHQMKKDPTMDVVMFHHPPPPSPTATNSTTSSSSSSSSLPLIHFIKKYTNLPFSTAPAKTMIGHGSIVVDTTTTTAAHHPAKSSTRQTVLQVTMSELYDILGMIRALQYDLELYNESLKLVLIPSGISPEEYNNELCNINNRIRYQRYRWLQQVQHCCPRATMTPNTIISLSGLPELLHLIEGYYHRDESDTMPPEEGAATEIAFDHPFHHDPASSTATTTTLMDYCRPGTILIDTAGIVTGHSSLHLAVRCRSNRYRRTKTISGRIVSTHETAVEYVVALGRPHHDHQRSTATPTYVIVESTWVQTEFADPRPLPQHQAGNSQNPYGMLLRPTQSSLDELQQRGLLYQSFCHSNDNSSSSSGVFVQYQPGTFHPCHGTVRNSNGGSMSLSLQPSRMGGRMIVDLHQSYIRGIHVCKPPADGIGAETILPTFQSFARYLRRLSSSSTTPAHPDTNTATADHPTEDNGPDDLLVLYGPAIISEFRAMTWPVVCGFSLVTRNWGVVLVDGLAPISFRDTLFEDALVLSATRKRLLRAIVTCHGQPNHIRTDHSNHLKNQTASADALPGKGEGLIILLYGPPGVGKTLTAEAIAELLRRPLYRVSMGELGTTPEHLEERLQNIFDLCIPWQALVLIDEAELLLQARTSNEILRNAMVCVMLRLLEYYSGILFLTTNNGIDQLDAAIASRITVALEYKSLDLSSRKEIWRTCISRVWNHGRTLDGGEGTSAVPDIRSDDNITTLASQYDKLNGRQIKNAVQLASIICQYEELPLTLKSIQDVLEMTTGTYSTSSTSN